MTPRKLAINQKAYSYNGRACKKCGGTERRPLSGNCIPCQIKFCAEQYALEPGRHKESRSKWKLADKERCAAVKRAWKDANREKVAVYGANSNARRLQRIPKWSDSAACRVFYEIAKRVTRCTGIPFVVDHIIPLRGETVSGLHVPTNLRVIPAEANRRKGNKLIPELLK